VEDFVSVGGAMQRFWLTATRLGLQMQPEMTPLIFSMYAREGRRFSARQESVAQAKHVCDRLTMLVDSALERAVFMGRIGSGRPAVARSTRLDLTRLILH
jgi:hypothetical protein